MNGMIFWSITTHTNTYIDHLKISEKKTLFSRKKKDYLTKININLPPTEYSNIRKRKKIKYFYSEKLYKYLKMLLQFTFLPFNFSIRHDVPINAHKNWSFSISRMNRLWHFFLTNGNKKVPLKWKKKWQSYFRCENLLNLSDPFSKKSFSDENAF